MKKFKDYIKENTTYKSFNDIEENYINDNIYISFMKLNDLKGIEKYKKLKSLYCYENKLTTLEPLKNLINLEKLFFSENEIVSLEPLKNLINLITISCSNNKLKSFKGLPENITYIFGHENPLNNWQEDVESFIRAYKCSIVDSISKNWFDKQEKFSEIIDLIKINMI